MSTIILDPKWLFNNKPKKVNRVIQDRSIKDTLWLDHQEYILWIGWATLYGACQKVFSIDAGKTWHPIVTEDGKILLGSVLPELTERGHGQLEQQGYLY